MFHLTGSLSWSRATKKILLLLYDVPIPENVGPPHSETVVNRIQQPKEHNKQCYHKFVSLKNRQCAPKMPKIAKILHSERHGTFLLQNVCRPRRIQPPPPHPGGQPHLAQTQVTADFFKFLTFGTEPPGTLHTFTMPGKRKYLEKEKQLPYNCLHCKHRTVVFLLHAPCCISHRCFSCVPAPRPFGSHQVWQNLPRLPSMCPKRINLHWVYK